VMPDHPQILKAAALNLFAMADYDQSARLFSQLLKYDPVDCAATLNRGLACYLRGRVQQGVNDFKRSLIINPSYLEGWVNLGCHFKDTHQFDDARRCLGRAIVTRPDDFRALYSLGHIELAQGNYLEGWRLYEYGLLSGERRKASKKAEANWDGLESLTGKTILLRMEQGLGDAIQNLRFVSLLEKRGAHVIAELPRTLHALVPHLECIELNQPCSGADFECHILSLPHLLDIGVQSIPASDGYLQANLSKAAKWRACFGDHERMRIGVAWSGSKNHLNDQFRSIPLDVFALLFQLDANFHVLKNELQSDEKRLLLKHRNVCCHEADLRDFSDTAALIDCLDLVITVDTSVAHLSGALGKKCCVVLSNRPDYRWMSDRVDSPWYKSITLVRQGIGEEWSVVILRLIDLLGLKEASNETFFPPGQKIQWPELGEE
jgi:Tfp pilus assembly protein PilF